MSPEALAFCLEDTREQIMDSIATAQSTGLYQPTVAEQLRRQVWAVQVLARGNDRQREEALYYAGRMRGEK